MSGVTDWKEDAKAFPEFTRKQIREFHDAFVKFDADGSGSIDAKELESLLNHFFEGSDKSSQVQEFIQVADVSKNGTIEWKEFLKMIHYFYPGQKAYFKRTYLDPVSKYVPELSKSDVAVCLDVFRTFDEDDSESLESAELGKVLKYMGQGYTQETLNNYLAPFSGSLSWINFLQLVSSFYPEKLADFRTTFLEPAKSYPEFTRPDIESLISSFREFDSDDSGTIDVSELSNLFKYLGMSSSKEKCQQILEKHDADKSGNLDWNEFLEVMSEQYSWKMTEFQEKFVTPARLKFPDLSSKALTNLVEAFREHDEDGSGNIDVGELRGLVVELGQNATNEKLAELVNKYDENGNGTLEWLEFVNLMLDIRNASETTAESVPTATVPVKTEWTPTRPSATIKSGANKCPVCSKSVYATEGLNAGHGLYHKACFRCEEHGCGLSLNLKNFKSAESRIWCEKHVPKVKATSVGIEGNLLMQSQASAPKAKKTQGIKKDARMSFAPGALSAINPEEDAE